MNFRNLEDFWAFYMTQHSKPSTRRWHFAGTLTGILIFIYSLLFNWRFFILIPIIGYGLAWYSHFFIERNLPATFGHPIWSFLCDFKMFGFMLTGRMDKEIKRLGDGWRFAGVGVKGILKLEKGSSVGGCQPMELLVETRRWLSADGVAGGD